MEINKIDENLVIIDADSLVYLVGYNLAGVEIEMLGIRQLDEMIESILKDTFSPHYVGFFGKIGGRNFRYDMAVTKPYKGTRPDKEDWYVFWEPVLKKHMENVWGFNAVDKVEADDAVIIAHKAFNGKFNKVIIASPDKDLKQCAGHHFDYKTKIKLEVDQNMADQLFCKQLLLGDSTDGIPGLPGCGKKGAEDVLVDLMELEGDLLAHTRKYYNTWFQDVLVKKSLKKLEKDYLTQYKLDNSIKVLRAANKSEALAEFEPDMSFVKTDEEVETYYNEMYALLRMLDTEEEGLLYDFKLQKSRRYNKIDWSKITEHKNVLENLPTENDFKGFNSLEGLEGI